MRSQSFNYPGYDNKVMFPYQEFEELQCLLQEAKDEIIKLSVPCNNSPSEIISSCCKAPIVTNSIPLLTTDLQDSIGTGAIVVAGDLVYVYNGTGVKTNVSSYTYIGKRSYTLDELDPGDLTLQLLQHIEF